MSFGRVVVGPGAGERIWQLGNVFHVKATGDETAGAYALLEQECAGAPPPRHIHHDEEEAFYVISGTLEVHVGDDVIEAGAGSFCLVPRGTPHTFVSRGEEPARVLVLLSPPGFEAFFAACEDRFPEGEELPPPEVVGVALGELAAGHGLEIVGPPPA